jgi:anti-sigma B factor antagonist
MGETTMTDQTSTGLTVTEPELDDREFRCLVEHEAHRCTVSLHGELDLRVARTLERRLLALLQLPLQEMVIDLSELGFIDSTGLTALVQAQRAAEEARIDFAVCHARERVEWMLSLTGLEPLELHAA